PQVMSAKVMRMKADDPKRTAAFQDVIKQFEAFIQKFPASDEAEGAQYGRALAHFQIKDYDKAVEGLRQNLAKFPKSESILESQYLLALTLTTQANAALSGSQANKVAGFAQFDEAEKLLRDITQKRTDV